MSMPLELVIVIYLKSIKVVSLHFLLERFIQRTQGKRRLGCNNKKNFLPYGMCFKTQSLYILDNIFFILKISI